MPPAMQGGEAARMRCFARLRPIWQREQERLNKGVTTTAIEPIAHKQIRTNVAKKVYEFDRVFDASDGQAVVFEHVAKDMVDHAINGYCGTLFMYGQTGTGKTHTISCRDPGQEGIIPRAVDYIYQHIANDKEGKYTVKFNYVQLYRDNVEDLMTPGEELTKEGNPALTRIELFEGLKLHESSSIITSTPSSASEFMDIYERGAKKRAIRPTGMNANSSRGHTLLFVFIDRVSRNSSASPSDASQPLTLEEIAASGQTKRGRLIFADLAGFERMTKTQISDPIRQHEAATINTSLTHLGGVIRNVKDGAQPGWRNSKLTRLLQDSIGGNSITSVVVTMNTLSEHLAETTNSLHFGQTILQVVTTVRRLENTGETKKNLQMHYNRLLSKVQLLEAENEELKQRNQELAKGSVSADTAERQEVQDNLKLQYTEVIEQMTRDLEQRESELTQSELKISEITKQYRQVTEAYDEKRLEHDAVMEEVETALKSNYEEIDALKQKCDTADTTIHTLSENLHTLSKDLDAEEAKNVGLKAQLAACGGEGTTVPEEIQALSEEVSKLKGDNERLNKENKQLSSAVTELAEQLEQETLGGARPQPEGAPASAMEEEDLNLQGGGGAARGNQQAPGAQFSTGFMAGFMSQYGDQSDIGGEEDDESIISECSVVRGATDKEGFQLEDDEFSDEDRMEEEEGDGGMCSMFPSMDEGSRPSIIQCPRCGFDVDTEDTESKDQDPSRVMGTAAQSLWRNSTEASLSTQQDPTFPSYKDLALRGKTAVDSILMSKGSYSGGEEGASHKRWFRVWRDNRTNEDIYELVQEGRNLYKLTEKDVGCCVLFEYVPVDSKGRVGLAVWAKSDKVGQGDPTATNIRIEGECLCGQTLFPSFKFKGGVQGNCIVQWYKSVDGHSFYEITRNKLPGNKLYLSADVVHHYIRISVVPVSADEVRGKPSYSKLVYVNVEKSTDDIIKSTILHGFVAFNVTANEGKANEQPVVLQLKASRLQLLRVNPKGGVPATQVSHAPTGAPLGRKDNSHEVLFTIPWSNNIQMHTAQSHSEQGGSSSKFFLREIKKQNKAMRVMFSVESRNDRDIVMLAFRAFYAMARPHVAQVALGGDGAKEWKRNKWYKSRLDKRTDTMERVLEKPLPLFSKYTNQHRPGCKHTFMHRLEESLIENELDSKPSKGSQSLIRQLPFTVD